MFSLCHGVDEFHNAVIAISRDWQEGCEVDSDSLPASFAYEK